MFQRDDNAIVLDFLAKGRAMGKPEPLAQIIGEKYFRLLEVVIKPGVTLKQGDRIYIGEGEWKEVERVKRRIGARDLTSFAKNELPFTVEKIVRTNEEYYVNFFNKSQPISTRVHQMELLPGIGKKHMFDILDERKKSPFKSFEDLRARVKFLPDPVSTVVKRILQEIENDNERFRLFVAGPPRPDRY